MLYALILPHGIIETPTFILAGSIGTKLGFAALRLVVGDGDENQDYLSKIFRRAVYIVVGLVPVFLIAGLIEADVTPITMQRFGWR